MSAHNFASETQTSAVAATHINNATLPGQAPTKSQRLLSKRDVAEIFGVSLRCIDYRTKAGLVPPSVTIGGRRYWHPEQFQVHLDAMMGLRLNAQSESVPTQDDSLNQVSCLTTSSPSQEAPAPSANRTSASKPRLTRTHSRAQQMQKRCNDSIADVKRRLGLA